MAVRLVLATCALALAIWLGLSCVAERHESRATSVALSGGEVSPERVNEAIRLARRARAWQPDTVPKIVEWSLTLRQGRQERAEALLRQVLASEPENADAWGHLARTTRDRDLADEARRRLHALRPR